MIQAKLLVAFKESQKSPSNLHICLKNDQTDTFLCNFRPSVKGPVGQFSGTGCEQRYHNPIHKYQLVGGGIMDCTDPCECREAA